MKKLLVLIVVVVAGAAVALAITGRGQHAVTRGADIPEGVRPVKVAQVLKHADEYSYKPVLLEGKMAEKCAMAGCWFYLSDDTGKIRVDTQFAGFNVLDVKKGSKVTVYGKMVKPEDGEAQLSALGARF